MTAITILAALFCILAACIFVYFVKKSMHPLTDFADTEPMRYDTDDCREQAVSAPSINADMQQQDIDITVFQVERASPTMHEAQDNLNYKLWHQLLWLIPNTQWIYTQHQSLVEVQWLCLGPDHRHFIAHAKLAQERWTWVFTQA